MPGLSGPGLSPADGATADVHQITLTTTDGVRLHLGCASDTDVLTAAEQAGYVLPSLCRRGTCGACLATVDGPQARGQCSSQALSADAVTAGGALLCRTYPHGPLQVSLRCEESRIIRGGIRRRDAEVIGVDPVRGTGLAPIASMLRRMAEWGDPQQIRLYLGATTPAQLPRLGGVPGLVQALTELPGAEVECLVRQPDGDWSGSVGTPVDALVRDLAATVGGVYAGGRTAASPDVYVCGPPVLVDATIAATQSAGLPAGQVHAERFLPG